MKKYTGWALVFGVICSALGYLVNSMLETETKKKMP